MHDEMILLKSLYSRKLILISFFLIGIMALFLVSANADDDHDKGRYIIKGVPFYPQLKDFCGPASLASIINYWGGNVSQEEIGKRIFRKELKGSLSIDMLLYVREKGFNADIIRGDIESVKKEIRENRPVLAFLNVGFKWFPRWHYLVIFGYDDLKKTVLTHSGRKEVKTFKYTDFLNKWKDTDYWGLTIMPQDKAQ